MITSYRPQLARGVARLHTEMWSSDLLRNGRYLKWKYRDNPCWVALAGDEVIGMRGAFGLTWRQGRRRARCYSASDAMVAPAHRRQGLFARLTETMLASLPTAAFINLSSYVTSAAGYRQQGWQELGSWQLGHRRLTTRRQNSLAPGRAGQPTPFAVLDLHAGRGIPHVTVARRPRPAVMAALVQKEGEVAPVRDAAFYSWRYGNPLSQYRFVFLDDERGFIALQWSTRAASARVNVVEWEARTPNDKALLLEAAMTWGDFDGLSVWAAQFSLSEQTLLGRLGFDLLDHDSAGSVGLYCPRILVRPGAAFLQRIPPLSRWSVPGIASDNF